MSEEMKRSYTPTTIDEYNKIVDGAFILKSPEETKGDNIRSFALKELQILEKKCLDDESEPPEEREDALHMQQYMSACILHMLDACSDCGFSGGTIGYAIGIFNRLISFKPVSAITEDDFVEAEDPYSVKACEESGTIAMVCPRVSPPIHASKNADGNLTNLYACGMISIAPMYHANFIMGGRGHRPTALEKAFMLPTTSCKTFEKLPISPNDLNEETKVINCYQNYLRDAYYDLFDVLDIGSIDDLPGFLNATQSERVVLNTRGRGPAPVKIHDITYHKGCLIFTGRDEEGGAKTSFVLGMHGTYNGKNDVDEAINFMRGLLPREMLRETVSNISSGINLEITYAIINYSPEAAAHTDRFGNNVSLMIPIYATHLYQNIGIDSRSYLAMFDADTMQKIVTNASQLITINFDKVAYHVTDTDPHGNNVWRTFRKGIKDPASRIAAMREFLMVTKENDHVILNMFHEEKAPLDRPDLWNITKVAIDEAVAKCDEAVDAFSDDRARLDIQIANYRAEQAHLRADLEEGMCQPADS